MTTRLRSIGLILFGALIWGFAPALATGESHADVSAAVNYTALQPGSQAVMAIVVDIHPGLHAQSHTPKPGNIKFTMRIDANPAVDFQSPVFPAGTDETYPALGTLNVYTNRVIIYVPFSVKSDAKPGALEITGAAKFQACDATACFLPETDAFTLDTQIVPLSQALAPNQPELFKGFDSSALASTASDPAADQPIDLFGLKFTLKSDAYALGLSLAFLVGILFNVVPCVLPIIPLKAIGFYEASKHNRAKSFFLGLVFSAGIVSAFGVLAQLIVVKQKFAWGEQFSNPYFTGAMIIILVIVALGTFGVFNFVLPTGIYRFAPSHETVVGNYFMGILTALLSTPCTFGLFVGLLAWAVTQPPRLGVLIILTVGAGMAFPYLLLSALPELARKFPRTGPWAELIKQMAGFLLLGTALYFARTLVDSFVGDHAFWWMGFALATAAAIFLVARTREFTTRSGPRAIGMAIGGLIVAVSFTFVWRITHPPIDWQPYSQEALATARQSGKPVMLEFTANWCGNCIYLETHVLDDKQVAEAIKANGILPMRADMSVTTAPGRGLLDRLSPAGAIPLTVIYRPGGEQPFELSGIYSKADLLRALGSAQ